MLPQRYLFSITGLSFSQSQSATGDDGLVERVHPGWKGIVRTSQFAQWLNSQPANIRELANSSTPADAIRLLDLYQRSIEEQTAGSTNGARRVLTAPELFEKLSSSVVSIRSKSKEGTSQGSGVSIGRNGDGQLVVTNLHVVSSEVIKAQRGGRDFSATLLYADPDLDIALLSVANSGEWSIVDLNISDHFAIGSPAYAIWIAARVRKLPVFRNSVWRAEGRFAAANSNNRTDFSGKQRWWIVRSGYLIGITTSKVRGGENSISPYQRTMCGTFRWRSALGRC